MGKVSLTSYWEAEQRSSNAEEEFKEQNTKILSEKIVHARLAL